MKPRHLLYMTSLSLLSLLQQDTLPFALSYKPASNEVKTTSLVLNMDNTKRLFAFKSLDEGLDELQVLAKTTAYEESYAFFPTKQLWMELGYEEKLFQREGRTVTASVRINYSLMDSLVNVYGPGMVFHTHPDGSLPKTGVIEQRPAPSAQDAALQDDVSLLLGNRRESRPSLADCYSLWSMVKKYSFTIPRCSFYAISSGHVAKYQVKSSSLKEDLFIDIDRLVSQDTVIIQGPNAVLKVWPRTSLAETQN